VFSEDGLACAYDGRKGGKGGGGRARRRARRRTRRADRIIDIAVETVGGGREGGRKIFRYASPAIATQIGAGEFGYLSIITGYRGLE